MGGPIGVAPVEHGDVRYEAIHWGKQRDLGQNGGFVAEIDNETDKENWIVRIYEIEYGPKSPQKYDRFITDMALDEARGELIIEDESGAVHRLNLATREVRMVRPPTPDDDEPDPDMPPKRKPGFWQRLFGD